MLLPVMLTWTGCVVSYLQLLGNITSWEGVLSCEAVQQLSVDGLLNRYLLLSLQNCPVDASTVKKTRAVSTSSSSSQKQLVSFPLSSLLFFLPSYLPSSISSSLPPPLSPPHLLSGDLLSTPAVVHHQ